MSERELRIGDAEREAAVSALGDHYAAGRLTKEEYDERSEQAWAARTNAELYPLFLDLPSPAANRQRTAVPKPPAGSSREWDRRPRGGRWGVPIWPLVLLLVILVVVGHLWPLLILLGVLWFTGVFRRGCARSRR